MSGDTPEKSRKDFKEKPGRTKNGNGLDKFALQDVKDKLERINDGPLSGYSNGKIVYVFSLKMVVGELLNE